MVAMFVSRIGRWASMRRSTIGEGERDSTTPQRKKSAPEAKSIVINSGDVQPQRSPSVSATISVSSAAESASAPGTSTFEGVRIGDSGTKRCTSRIDSATGIEPKRKRSRHEKLSTITPERTIPKPPPTPQTAESRPIPTLTLSAGNSSRMIAKLSGKSAPPAPETTRKAISDQRFQAKAAEDRGQDRARHEEAREHPGRPGGARPELLLEGPDRREDHRLLERERGAGEGQD